MKGESWPMCCHDIAPEDEAGDLELKKKKEFLKAQEELETEELLRGFCNG
jgi:hypothetical protein